MQTAQQKHEQRKSAQSATSANNAKHANSATKHKACKNCNKGNPNRCKMQGVLTDVKYKKSSHMQSPRNPNICKTQ